MNNIIGMIALISIASSFIMLLEITLSFDFKALLAQWRVKRLTTGQKILLTSIVDYTSCEDL
jgi:hypothetical protein